MKILIEDTEYIQLVKDSITLRALEGAGVDNWDGYGDALRSAQEDIYAVTVPA
jgi:hypothetical protein